MVKVWMVCVLLLASVPRVDAAPACACPDLKAIQYRIKEIQAIIKTYQAEIARIGPNQPFKYDDYRAFQDQTQQPMLNALKRATPGAPSTFGGSTHPMTCSSSFPKAATPCLRAALEKHEAHHANVCGAKKGGAPALTADYREGASLAAAYEEEIVAYTIELDALDAALQALPDTCKPQNWFLRFDVEISGAGASKNGRTAWKIKHEYSGAIELTDMGKIPRPPKVTLTSAQISAMTPQQQIQMAQNMAKNMTYLRTWTFKSPTMYVPIEVEIDDTLTREGHDPGEGGSFEDTKTTTIWKNKVVDEVQNSFRLELDEATQLYNIHIPLALMGTKKTIHNDVTTEINRSPYGYGNAPTHEGPTTVSAMIEPKSMQIPTAASVLVSSMVTHDKDLPFAPTGDILSFDSGRLPMDKGSTFLSNLPDAAKNVQIHVTYTLSKRPIN